MSWCSVCDSPNCDRRCHDDQDGVPVEVEDDTLPLLAEGWCETCRLFHDAATSCELAGAAAYAMIVEVGDEIDSDLPMVDRPALLRALRLRGISVESDGGCWRAVATVAS